jgi:hypothetical protein
VYCNTPPIIVIRRRAFRGFFPFGFPRKNLCSCFSFDLLLFARFCNKWYQSFRLKIDLLPRRFLVARLGSTTLFRSTSAVLHHQAASSKLATVVFSRDPIYRIDMVLASAVHAFPLVICFPHRCRSIKLPRSPSPSSCSWFLSGTIFNPALYYVL